MSKTLSLFILGTVLFACVEQTEKRIVLLANETTDTTEDVESIYHISYSADSTYSDFINGLNTIQSQTSLQHDSISDVYSCQINFDDYFKVFDKLSIAENWKLESHYRHFGDAGRPFLMAFEQGNKSSENIQKQLSKTFENEKYKGILEYAVSKSMMTYQDSINYFNAIRIEDTKMGYFQYMVFNLIGDNYCKFWHSNYGELALFTSKEQLIEFTNDTANFYYKFTEETQEFANDNNALPNGLANYELDKQQVLGLNPAPEININKDFAVVKVLTLSPWSGFLENSFSISRSWPHTIEHVQIDTLIPYNCGITF